MPWYSESWDSLGWTNKTPIRFYAIDHSKFGGLIAALPPNCGAALAHFGTAHRVAGGAQDIKWSVHSFDNANSRPVTKSAQLDGTSKALSKGCAEHGFWSKLTVCDMDNAGKVVIGGPYHTLFAQAHTMVIYAVLAPCLNCCNALFGLSRYLDMNIVVRCQYDYELTGLGKVKFDMTLAFPRQNEIGSVTNPAPSDRVVYMLHDGQQVLKNSNVAQFGGNMAPTVWSCSPHTQKNAPRATGTDRNYHICPSLKPDMAQIAYLDVCDHCAATVTTNRDSGTSLPWGPQSKKDGYNPKFLTK